MKGTKKRKGAGRPKATHPERVIKIRCTPAEYARIIASTTPRQRAVMLTTTQETTQCPPPLSTT